VTLKYVMDHLAAVPDRRKMVFFVSTGYNLDLSDPGAVGHPLRGRRAR
jgi:hypothetical protein